MSALAVIVTSTLTGVIGAAAMYVPARLALRDARTYRDEADRTFGAAESLADEVERTRNLPWHYAIESAPEEEAAEHEGEVLHVEHATGELPVVMPADQFDDLLASIDEADLAPRLAQLADEVGLAQALSDRPAEDDDEVGEEQPGEAWTDTLRQLPSRLRAALARKRAERHMVGSGEQATDRDPFAELLAHVEQQPVTIVHRDHRYRDPGMTGQFPLVKVVGDKAAGRHRAEIPAQREAAE